MLCKLIKFYCDKHKSTSESPYELPKINVQANELNTTSLSNENYEDTSRFNNNAQVEYIKVTNTTAYILF